VSRLPPLYLVAGRVEDAVVYGKMKSYQGCYGRI
jgi:hypothetical protein